MKARIEIRLEVEPDSDPITGRLRGGHIDDRDFRGWVEMMAAVEDARIGGREEAEAATGREGEDR